MSEIPQEHFDLLNKAIKIFGRKSRSHGTVNPVYALNYKKGIRLAIRKSTADLCELALGSRASLVKLPNGTFALARVRNGGGTISSYSAGTYRSIFIHGLRLKDGFDCLEGYIQDKIVFFDDGSFVEREDVYE